MSPIGLLVISSILAIVGLFALSKTGSSGLSAIFVAATLYGFGKTFFWPTMLGVTAEQCPKGGAMTLNAISGIGMIAVGVLGFPFIGALQENTASTVITAKSPAVAEVVLTDKKLFGIEYRAIDPDEAKTVASEEDIAVLAEANEAGQFNALAKMAFFPSFMLICYIALFLYFKSKGGYKAVEIGGSEHAVGGADEAMDDGAIAGGEEGPRRRESDPSARYKGRVSTSCSSFFFARTFPGSVTTSSPSAAISPASTSHCSSPIACNGQACNRQTRIKSSRTM